MYNTFLASHYNTGSKNYKQFAQVYTYYTHKHSKPYEIIKMFISHKNLIYISEWLRMLVCKQCFCFANILIYIYICIYINMC